MLRTMLAALFILSLPACSPLPITQLPPDTVIISPPADQPMPPVRDQNPYAPQPGDKALQRDAIQVSNAQIATTSSLPVRITVFFTYTLPTACHHLRVAISGPDSNNRIDLEFYTLVDPNQACIKIAPGPVSDGIALETLPAGTYSLRINGEKLGEVTLPESSSFDLPYEPQPSDAVLVRSEVYLDETDILIMESYPVQIALLLQGSLPTPCHALRVAVSAPDAKNRIFIDVYSVTDPNQICIQVLAPLNSTVPLGSFASGHYTVWVNGEQIGEFDS
ncbi:MAG: hypothetical protein QMD04_03495 [Anaerolineales bacterium]|nr:hypothetical protein [Anaerolineales bacterium]